MRMQIELKLGAEREASRIGVSNRSSVILLIGGVVPL